MTLRVLHLSIALLCWLAFALKLPDLWRERSNGAMRSLCTVFLGLAVALTAAFPPVYALIDAITGMPNLARLIQHIATIIACSGIAVFYVQLRTEGAGRTVSLRWRRVLTLATCVAITILFVQAPVDVSEPILFADRYSTAPYIPAFMLLSLAFSGWACADIGYSALHHARQASTARMRQAVRMFFAAAVIGVVYSLFKASYVVAYWAGFGMPVREATISFPLALLTVVLAVLGLLWPKLGKATAAAATWLERRRTYLLLYPLWRDIYRLIPQVALDPPRRYDGLALVRLEYRLYRRIIEIRDGILALRPHYDAGVIDRARQRHGRDGLTGPEMLARIEAAALADVIARGKTPSRPADSPCPVWQPDGDGGPELPWLSMIASAYRAVYQAGGHTR